MTTIEPDNDPTSSFRDHFLVALNSLEGDYFHQSLTLIIDHTADGSFGLIINRPTKYVLSEVFPQLPPGVSCPVLEGGPVEQDKMFFLHNATQNFDSTLKLNSEVWLTTSKDFIIALENDCAPEPFLPIVGYAGWGPGQLEQELGDNTWLITPSKTEIIFEMPNNQRASAAARLLGVDLHLISPKAGHD